MTQLEGQHISGEDIERRIFVQISSQIGLVVRGNNVFRTLQERVLKWGFDSNRNLRNIPAGAWEGETFEIDQDNSEQAQAIKLDQPKYWAFRLRERLKDTSRTWTTEVSIAERDPNEAVIGVRLICAQRGNAEPIPRSIPRFVRGIAFTQNATLDGRLTSADPWIVDTETGIDELVEFLKAPYRNHPVVVFATAEDNENPDETAIPVRPFIRRVVGFAHVVVVTSNASFALTDQLGREFSVYRQAVRTYNPGFDPTSDLPSDHAFASASRIANWDENGGNTFTDFLVEQTLRVTRPRNILEREQPTFQHIKRIAAQQARESASAAGQSDAEILLLADEETKAAKQEAETSLEMALNADSEREEAISELRQIKASYIALQQRLDSLLAEGETNDAVDIPDRLDNIEDWAQVHLSGQVELHTRAIKALRGSNFKDPEFVYKVLLMMRDHYVPMRRIGGTERKQAFDQKLAELGLENTPCFSKKIRPSSSGENITFDIKKQKENWIGI